MDVICLADIPEPDTSYMLPWRRCMLYEVEPKLKDIENRTISWKRRNFSERLDAYTAAKDEAWELVGWYARDPRLRSSEAWDCFFRHILDELRL